MSNVYATIRLRPVRIGFLAPPTDLTVLRRILVSCSCIWGGNLNPIIPIGRTVPEAWKDKRENVSSRDLARGYVRFFEPDVFVETNSGQLKRVGLEALKRDRGFFRPETKTLAGFLTAREGREWNEPAFSLPIIDVLREQYKEEQRFVLRDPRSAIIVKPARDHLAAEAIFGCYPKGAANAHFERGYRDVFQPDELECGPEAWLRVYRDGALTPIIVTRHGLELDRAWHDEPTVFIFDPSSPLDIIDLWNLRLEARPVLPVPIAWVETVASFLQNFLREEHRPLRGNAHGVMHHSTVEFARSLSDEQKEASAAILFTGLEPGVAHQKYWRTPVWKRQRENLIRNPERMRVTAEETSVTLEIQEGRERTVTFDTLAPSFASKFGNPNAPRWVNAVQVKTYGDDTVGTAIPFNTYDRSWPQLLYSGVERTVVGKEGWIFPQTYLRSNETIRLASMESIVQGALKQRGLDSAPSEPGRIMKQMLQRLDGLSGVRLVGDPETLQLLNRMAGAHRIRTSEAETIEETFAGRTATLQQWVRLTKQRASSFRGVGLEELTAHDVLRVGLETECPHCEFKNWSSLDVVSYALTCERCLNVYDFPQGGIADKSKNFAYRAIGPFAIPDYGRGSYAALLTLNVLANLGGRGGSLTFTGATLLKASGFDGEADFVALCQGDGIRGAQDPDLVLGECKSFGSGTLIRSKDLLKLKALGSRLPGAVIVIAVMCEGFLQDEEALLRKFVSWARRPDQDGYATNPVVLLTGHELFTAGVIYEKWKKLGGRFAPFAEYQHTKDLQVLAETTQSIYLDMPPYWKWREAQRKT